MIPFFWSYSVEAGGRKTGLILFEVRRDILKPKT